jgi:hypothetical protein
MAKFDTDHSGRQARGMDVGLHLFCFCVLLSLGSGLATDSSSVQGVQPTANRIKKLKKPPNSKGL